ncbi:MAG: proline dehydrogenase family protein [Rhodothermaceae bacterium]
MNFINNLIVKFVKILPESVVYVFAKKYIAGIKLEEAVAETQKLNAMGICATMDILGEAIQNKEEAVSAKNEILEILDAIEEQKLDSNVSIKPTQLALGLDNDLCFELFDEICGKAKELNNFIRIDMEDSPYTDATFELLGKLHKKYDNVGIVVQAYLRRTIGDVKEWNPTGVTYRLCKGIYVEPEEIAFKGYQEVRDKYLEALEIMLDNGNYVGIATHDDYLVEGAYKQIKEKNIAKDKYEFQMLYGVKPALRDRINADGHKIRIYVPFGKSWYAYSIRRLQENPNMAWYITKSILTGQ